MNKTISSAKGMRDFGAEVLGKRNYIFSTIKKVFQLHGFQPLETPAVESLETLMGKYGEEGDKLMFKILNNGLNEPNKSDKARSGFERVLAGKSDMSVTDRALRYDLTIPFARYVSMNYGKLTFPFKRYQIQPVWRADRPQKGRYREFYQCDADVVGSHSLLNELDLLLIYSAALRDLKLADCKILINSRQILKGIIKATGLHEWEKLVLTNIDKKDKIGFSGVTQNLLQAGIPNEKVSKLINICGMELPNLDKVDYLKFIFETFNLPISPLQDLAQLINTYEKLTTDGPKPELALDFTLARGLDYYTGIIFEVQAPEQVKIGSIGGGGRYDNLTEMFGIPNLSGVGISFGVDRIYDVLIELNRFPPDIDQKIDVIFFNQELSLSSQAFEIAEFLRMRHYSCEIFPDSLPIEKQVKYAKSRGFRYALSFVVDMTGITKLSLENFYSRKKDLIDSKNFELDLIRLLG